MKFAENLTELVNEQNRIYLQQPERIHIDQISERPENGILIFIKEFTYLHSSYHV